MSETLSKDPTIKLFGQTIPFQDLLPEPAGSLTHDKDTIGGKLTEAKQEPANPDGTLGISENPKTPSGEETAIVKETEEEQSQTSVPQEKTLKKPDKILPCPRCNSMDTKFCYYNNYNVNQARHFCKSCQRYWTAGGTMRNVPVGAGRRKTKNSNSSSHFHHIAIPEASGTVLTFSSDAPPCESMASKPNRLQENGEDRLNGSSDDDVDKNESVESVMQNCQGVSPQTMCYPGAPWPYPWNSPMPPPFFFPPGFPMPFYPTAPYWGCPVPWFVQPPSPNQTDQTLGKHSRDEDENENTLKPSEEEQCKENNSKRCLWIPKTLRVDDPGEAAKSSIWATLGIKYDKADSVTSGGLFKAFRSKLDEKSHMTGTSPALHANPAALSRSLNFQESS